MRIRVTFDVEVPFAVEDHELVDEWIRFELGDRGDMSMDNPLQSMPPEPECFDWEEV